MWGVVVQEGKRVSNRKGESLKSSLEAGVMSMTFDHFNSCFDMVLKFLVGLIRGGGGSDVP